MYEIPLNARAYYYTKSNGCLWLHKERSTSSTVFMEIPPGEMFFVAKVLNRESYCGDLGWWYRVIYGEMIGFVHLRDDEKYIVSQVMLGVESETAKASDS